MKRQGRQAEPQRFKPNFNSGGTGSSVGYNIGANKKTDDVENNMDEPTASEDPDFPVTDEERYLYKLQKQDEWVYQMPLKIRQFIDHSNDISLRIYRDVVIRFPVIQGNKEEVLALCGEYGPCSYVSELNSLQKKDPPRKMTKGGLASVSDSAVKMAAVSDSVTDEVEQYHHCHLVRFDDGADAIQCYFSLNGAVIDPEKQCVMFEEIKTAMLHKEKKTREEKEKEAAERKANGEDDPLLEVVDNEEAEEEKMQQAVLGMEFPSMGPVDGGHLVFISVDFFRFSFVLPAATSLKGSSSTSMPSKSSLGTPVHSGGAKDLSRIPGATGMKFLQLQMKELSLTCQYLYPVVCSHNIPWEQFAWLLNYFSFLHFQNEPFSFQELCQAAKAIPSSSSLSSSSVTTTSTSTATDGGEHLESEQHRGINALAQVFKNSPYLSSKHISVAGAARTVWAGISYLNYDTVKALNMMELQLDGPSSSPSSKGAPLSPSHTILCGEKMFLDKDLINQGTKVIQRKMAAYELQGKGKFYSFFYPLWTKVTRRYGSDTALFVLLIVALFVTSGVLYWFLEMEE